ncbi:hypothetical protein JRC45_13075 [Escherichia albertii]|uniref:hypothetical protein n=1 Tax=Escherichia albertii TaxID=208962 RepID=UPI00195E8E16|nr:hypothetical protein JRC45_13075 [Escherichia albertii]
MQEIHDGGEALTTHIYGGAQYIDGGIADDTYIHSGTQNIDRGGKAIDWPPESPDNQYHLFK